MPHESMEQREDLESRKRLITDLEGRSEEQYKRHREQLKSGQTQEESDRDDVEAAALYNLIRGLKGEERILERNYLEVGPFMIRVSEKKEQIDGKSAAVLAQEIDGYITRDRAEIEKMKETGKEPPRRLIEGLKIQERKRELLRELAGL